MSLADDYARQFAWRDWGRALGSLPLREGVRVLDLGCAHGDLARELALGGAEVLAVDGNEELLAVGRARGLARVEFRAGDARHPPVGDACFDGLWASFLAAYFVELGPVLSAWRELLEPGGWIALTEIDDLFAHGPLAARTTELLEGYVGEARAAGRYDFRMGRRLALELARAGFRVELELELEDREFRAAGALAPEVLSAWRARLARMRLLHEHCGPEWPQVEADLLSALASPEHTSRARVVFVLARRA